ncbi:MAG: hypothetical protein LBD55_10300 [Treponema sp.]|jgi:hypothetical protein|nr:hypothetical protein [Treponema sp.]
MALLPAKSMTVAVACYIIVAPEGLSQAYPLGLGIGLALAAVLFALFVPLIGVKQRGLLTD